MKHTSRIEAEKKVAIAAAAMKRAKVKSADGRLAIESAVLAKLEDKYSVANTPDSATEGRSPKVAL